MHLPPCCSQSLSATTAGPRVRKEPSSTNPEDPCRPRRWQRRCSNDPETAHALIALFVACASNPGLKQLDASQLILREGHTAGHGVMAQLSGLPSLWTRRLVRLQQHQAEWQRDHDLVFAAHAGRREDDPFNQPLSEAAVAVRRGRTKCGQLPHAVFQLGAHTAR